MSQSNLSIANEGGASFRADNNAALQALVSSSSGASAPATTYADQLWYDTTNQVLKKRNQANSAWFVIGTRDETFVISRSSNTILGLSDFGKTFIATGTFTQTLTAAATLGDGWSVYYRNDGAGVTTLDPNASETIDGTTTINLSPGQGCRIACNGSAFKTQGLTSGTALRSYLAGLTLSTAGASTTMTTAAGVATDGGNTVSMILSSALAKTTSAWAVGTGNGGLDTGSITASASYHFYLIERPDNGVVDILFSLSASAPTMPTNYTLKRRIGSWTTTGASQWSSILQDGDLFQLVTPVLDVSVTNAGSSAVTRTLTGIPTGINVQAILNVEVVNSATADGVYLSDLAIADLAASTTVAPLAQVYGIINGTNMAQVTIRTNTSGQIRTRETAGAGDDTLRIATCGWIDHRGRDA